MADKYRVLFSSALGYYKGEIVDGDAFGGQLQPFLEMGAVEKVTDAESAPVIPGDLTDGDGNAVTADGVNLAPDAPPQKTDTFGPDGAPVRPATTSEPIGGTPVDDALDDAALAEKLKAAGYDTAEKVSAASDDDLRAIPGVGPASVAKIRAAQASA